MNIKHLFRTRYRVVPGEFCGYKAEYRHWYMPFYLQCYYDTRQTVEGAREIIENHKKRVMYSE